jgi:hypothetical protein
MVNLQYLTAPHGDRKSFGTITYSNRGLSLKGTNVLHAQYMFRHLNCIAV